MKKITLAAIILAGTTLIAAPSSAITKTSAVSNYERGMELFHKKNWNGAFSAFRLVEPTGDRTLAGNVEFFSGMALLRLEKIHDAKTSFLEASKSRLIGDWALYYLAEICLTEKEYEEVIKVTDIFFEEFPFSPIADKAALLRAKGLRKLGRIDESITLLRETLKQNPIERENFYWELAHNLEISGDAEGAYEEFKKIYYWFPHLPLAEEAFKETSRMQKEYPGGFKTGLFKDQKRRIRILMRERKYREAEKYIASIKTAGLTHEDISALQLDRAWCLKKTGKKKDAISLYRKIINDRPKTKKRPTAQYRLARMLWNMGKDTNAKRILNDLTTEYPKHPKSGIAWYIKARIDVSAGKTESALKNYFQAAKRFPNSEAAEDSLWGAGWLHYEQGNYEEAEKVLGNFLKKYPFSESRPKALYWLGRSLEKQWKSGDEHFEILKSKHPYSYYAQSVLREGKSPLFQLEYSSTLEGEKLSRAIESRVEELAYPFSSEVELNETQKWYIKSVSNWTEMGFKEHAKILMAKLADELPDTENNLSFISYLNYKSANYQSIIKNFWRLTENHIKDERARELLSFLMFPFSNWETVVKESEKRGLNPMLVMSVIRQESGFNPAIVSSADARGLMQIIPSTGKNISRALKMENFDPEDLFEPKTNIKMGSFYMRYVIKESGGELVPAIASYNAGKKPVKSWLKRFPYENVEEFIEKIPYPETRGYVKKVLRNYGIYMRMYEQLIETKTVSIRQ